jgi:hypothetical protein
VLLRRPPRPRAGLPPPPHWSDEPASAVVVARSPFLLRLKRELLGLAVFFGLSAVALTVFFAVV